LPAIVCLFSRRGRDRHGGQANYRRRADEGDIRTWQALADGRPAPDLDPADLEQATYEAFATSDGWHPVDQLCESWLDLARHCGLAVDDEQGDLPGPTCSTPSATPSQPRSGSA
jgi:hypothetical protein